MGTQDHSGRKGTKRSGELQGRGEDARNSIDRSVVDNVVQANQITEGVHFHGVGASGEQPSYGNTSSNSAYDVEPPREVDAPKDNAFTRYFSRIIKEGSPLLLWSLFMIFADIATVALFEYLLGARLPGESPSKDLNTAQAGTFFAAIFAVVIIARHVARRNGSERWPSLSEVHPWIVDFLRRWFTGVIVASLLVLLAALLVPSLVDPAGLTTYTPPAPGASSNSGMSDFGADLSFFVVSLEVAAFCVFVNLRYRTKGSPGTQ